MMPMLQRFVRWLTPPKRMVSLITGMLVGSMIFLQMPMILTAAAHENFIYLDCHNCLQYVAFSSASDGWAISGPLDGPSDVGLVHWHDGQWQQHPTPFGDLGILSGIATTGPDDVWIAVESLATPADSTTVWHAHDGQWQQVGPVAPNDVSSLRIIAPDDIWAIASVYNDATGSFKNFFAHFNGHNWQETPTPHNVDFKDLTFTTDDGWAVGAKGAIARYHAGAWRLVSSPTTFDLNSVQMLSPNDGWAVGEVGEMLHYDGIRWSIFTPTAPTFSDLGDLQMASDTEGWAITPSIIGLTELWHYQHGVWAKANLPTQDQFLSVAAVGPGEAWAVGANVTMRDDNGFVSAGTGIMAHYMDGAWHLVTAPPTPEPIGVVIARIGLSLLVLCAMVVLGFLLFGGSAFPPKTAIRSWWTRIGSIFALVGNGAILVNFLTPLGPSGYDPDVELQGILVAAGAYIAVGICGMVLAVRFRKQVNPQTPAEILAQRKQLVETLMARGHQKNAADE
jgi:hypothetical protein